MQSKMLKMTETDIIKKQPHSVKRYPNLNTVLMVEDFLKEHREMPMKVSDIKRQLPRQVMHETLKVIFEYLWANGKIMYGPKGIQWIYSGPIHLQKMTEDTLEV